MTISASKLAYVGCIVLNVILGHPAGRSKPAIVGVRDDRRLINAVDDNRETTISITAGGFAEVCPAAAGRATRQASAQRRPPRTRECDRVEMMHPSSWVNRRQVMDLA